MDGVQEKAVDPPIAEDLKIVQEETPIQVEGSDSDEDISDGEMEALLQARDAYTRQKMASISKLHRESKREDSKQQLSSHNSSRPGLPASCQGPRSVAVYRDISAGKWRCSSCLQWVSTERSV